MGSTNQNLDRLHEHEEQLRAQSFAAIAASDSLADHLRAAEAAMDQLVALVKGHQAEPGSDDHTLQLVAMRLFNVGATTLKLGLGGYYQAAFQLLRDSLELVNLVDLFRIDKTAVTRWRTADDKALKREFGPAKVRLALEAHSNYAGQKRDKIYSTYSNHAAHMTYKGFHLTAPGNSPKLGPFFEESRLKALLEDIGRHLSHATLAVSSMLDSKEWQVLMAKSEFLEGLRAYHQKYIVPKP